ncbi:MAG: diacylglycerol/lipid kinase family protein [Acidobacteriota bacterium]
MTSFDSLTVIYNPKSSGDAPKLARQFQKDCAKRGLHAVLVPTARAGHATEIARRVAEQPGTPLVVSVSGDGGYNEVIHGVMSAKRPRGADRPIVALIAAGNANDHYRVMHDSTPLVERIEHDIAKPLDILELTTDHVTAFAHSYIGFGVTAKASAKLNQSSKTLSGEISSVVRAVWQQQPFRVTTNGHTKHYTSLVCANINQMAKVVKFADSTNARDGYFELIEHETLSLGALLFGWLRRNKAVAYYKQLSFTTDTLTAQLDGDTITLAVKAPVTVTVRCRKHALRSYYANA